MSHIWHLKFVGRIAFIDDSSHLQAEIHSELCLFEQVYMNNNTKNLSSQRSVVYIRERDNLENKTWS